MPQPSEFASSVASGSNDAEATLFSEKLPSLTHPNGLEETLKALKAQESFFRCLCDHHLLWEHRVRSMLCVQERRIVASVLAALPLGNPAHPPMTTSSAGIGVNVDSRNVADISFDSPKHSPCIETSPCAEHGMCRTASARSAEFPSDRGQHVLQQGGANPQRNPPLAIRNIQTASFLGFSWFRERVRDRRFEMCFQALIVVSAVNIGYQSHWHLQHIGENPPALFNTVDLVLSSCFTLELVARFFAEGALLLHPRSNQDFAWNASDAFVIIVSWLTFFFNFVESTNTVGIMRLVRMARIVRLVRVLRVMRAFSALRVMVLGVMNSAKMLLWALVLMFVIMFMFGTCIMHLLGDLFDDLRAPNEQFGETMNRLKYTDPSTETNVRLLLESFGSMQNTLLTLWLSATSGQDWGDTFYPLLMRSQICGMIFMLWVAFAILCVLNIVTGVFVESASKLSLTDKEVAFVEDLESRRRWAAEAMELFSEIDTDRSSKIDQEELVLAAGDVRVQALFRKIGVDIATSNAAGLFALLDYDHDGSLEADEFFEALQQLHGNAKSADLVRLKHESRKVRRLLQQLTDFVTEKLGAPSCGVAH
eukprot:TRINITY_DN17749_c0_g1_i1.p1 TRINITY_DN17749_c0_g1~~TRINITY_DN17749_c0_g1_i1.p1  ORF type:complete len:593 (+),score=91.12 TRINITY_DN17749_c0_g1_i1:81-1859(+)